MNIGFVGLGAMGLPMARNLLKAGHTVTAYNRTPGRTEELAAEGALVAKKPSEACRGEAVITMLADDVAVEQLVLGEGGLVASLPAGAHHVSMSTISVALSQRLAQAHEKAGSGYVAAPVFGRPTAAAAAQLYIVSAGPEAYIERSRALFEAMGQRTFMVGENAALANLVKVTGNFLIAAMLESLGEAFALGRKAGVDPGLLLEILTGTIFPAPIYKSYGGMIAEQKFDPAGFKLSLGLKDVRLALAAADTLNVPLPIASLVRDHFISAVARGRQDLDWSALALVCAEQAGL